MNRIYLTVCIIGMCLLCVNIVNGKDLIGVQSNVEDNIVEERTIVPYPMPNPKAATTSPVISIEKMPYTQEYEGRLHIRPYLNVRPNPNGRGIGTEFGLRFGFFRSHGLGFGINLY